MPITAGDISASTISQAIVAADRMWKDDMRKADFEANVGILNALIAEQNANVEILTGSEKERDVKVTWLGNCTNAVADDDNNDCTIDGEQVGSDSKVYSLTVKKMYKFSIDENAFRNNNHSMPEALATQFMLADKALCEAACATAMARIESFKGTNVVTDGIGTVNAGTTETDIAAADWNANTFAYLYRVAIQNQFSNPFLLSGTNLFEDRLTTMLAESNANGKGNANLFKLMRTYFDLFNIDPANSPNLKSYMINRGSVAFASKNYYNAVPTRYKDDDRYSIASRHIPGARFDVIYKNRCSGETILHDFKLKFKYDFFLNPQGCDADRTGILAFNRT